VNIKDLELLEFPAVRSIIASYCTFSLSRAIANALTPSNELKDVQYALAASSQARALLALEPSISVSDARDITDEVNAAARGKVADPSALAEIRSSLNALTQLRNQVIPRQNIAQILFEKASEIADFTPIIKAIDQAISSSGEILPNASPALEEIRRQKHSTRGVLVEKLQSLIASDSERRFIQEPIVTEREGRYVVAVKSERRGDVSGVVHDISNTGATIFVEPWQTLEIGNALKKWQIKEQHEIERIMAEISQLIGKESHQIEYSLEAAAAIDFELAKARFAKQTEAVEAQVYAPTKDLSPIICLSEARHPLLNADAVPLNLELGKDFSILMITGPNTGGKTVALKTIGLLCLMTQAGLPIPAGASTRLPILEGIFADIGDEQSIAGTMSTFGWHMSNISRILQEVKGASLILLDELGSSTDPQEGSALGRAILRYMLHNSVLGVVTTHYSELKVFAHTTPGLQNAAFEFNLKTLRPTYKLTLGTPGGSNAIATAASFSIPSEIVTDAQASLNPSAREMEELLCGLQSERNRLSELLKTVETQQTHLEQRINEVEDEASKLDIERQLLYQEARDDLVAEMATLQKEIKTALSSLKQKRTASSVSEARQIMQTTRTKLRDNRKLNIFTPSKTDSTNLSIGDQVWLNEYGVNAVVMSIDERNGIIEANSGAVRFKVKRDSLRKTEHTESKQNSRPQNFFSSRVAASELDLRGKRAEEVAILFDSYINNAALSGLLSVRIIHGFGTGTVRNIIREQAATHPLVKTFHAAPHNEGGEGATIAELK